MAEGSPPKKRTKQENYSIAPELPDELLGSQGSDIANGPPSLTINSSSSISSVIPSQSIPQNSGGIQGNLLSSHIPSSQMNSAQILIHDKPTIPASPNNPAVGSPHSGRPQAQSIASSVGPIQTSGINASTANNFGNPSNIQLKAGVLSGPVQSNNLNAGHSNVSYQMLPQQNHVTGFNNPLTVPKNRPPFPPQISLRNPIQISHGISTGSSTISYPDTRPNLQRGRTPYPNPQQGGGYNYNQISNSRINQHPVDHQNMQMLPSGAGMQSISAGPKFTRTDSIQNDQNLHSMMPLQPPQNIGSVTRVAPIRTGPSLVRLPPRMATPSPVHPVTPGPRAGLPSGPSSSVDPEKRKLIQQQLFLLLHAHKCSKSESNGEQSECAVVHCRTMKGVLKHMNDCLAGKTCQVAHCASSRQIIAHWKQCKRQDCSVCHPLKTTSKTIIQPGMRPANSDERISSHSKPLTQNEVQTVLGLTSSMKPPPDASLHNTGAGSSQPFGSNSSSETPDIAIVPPRSSKPWHVQVDTQLRNYLVQKLVKNIFPKPDKVSATDSRMIKLLAFARKVEGSMYEQADSRIEYLHLLAEKIYKIQKELEEKRKRGQQNPRQQPVNDYVRPNQPEGLPNVGNSIIVNPTDLAPNGGQQLPNGGVSRTIEQMMKAQKTINGNNVYNNDSGQQHHIIGKSVNVTDQKSLNSGLFSNPTSLPPVSTVNNNVSGNEVGIIGDSQTQPVKPGASMQIKSEPNSNFGPALHMTNNNLHNNNLNDGGPGGSHMNSAMNDAPEFFSSSYPTVSSTSINISSSGSTNSTNATINSFSNSGNGIGDNTVNIKQEVGQNSSMINNPSEVKIETPQQRTLVSGNHTFPPTPSEDGDGRAVVPTETKPAVTSKLVSNQRAPNKVFTTEELVTRLMPVWRKLHELDPEAAPFRQPVDPDRLQIPDYFDVVKNPMDLSLIRQKLEQGSFKEPWEFISDVWLMFQNAWLYNRKTSKVYKYCTRLKEVFEQTIDPVMRDLGYCCGRKLEFSPMTLCCYGKPLCTIQTGAVYFSYQNSTPGSSTSLEAARYDYCEKCYKEIQGDNVSINDEAGQGKTVPKSSFKKKKNDILDPEPFVHCNDCGRKLHTICVLHHPKIWPEKFVCDNCHRGKRTIRKQNRYTAQKLPQNRMSEHIEKRVNEYLRKNDTQNEAGYIHIRCVYSGEKSVEVKPGMKARFVDTKEMPESFPYKSKAFFAFQQLNGKEVCFFGVHVQEYGNSPPPNTRRIYLSYLDSVHFFRPRHLRTAVYHEILISYLHYCRTLGFEQAHIWACPPSEGDDYIFHCHPPEQKIPKPKRLQEWYRKMLDKAVIDQVIHSFNDIYKQAKEDRLQWAREIPYFEGDFWPNIMEESIKEVEQEEEDRKQAEANEQAAAEEGQASTEVQKKQKMKKGNKKASQRSAKKKIPQISSGLSDKLYQVMEKHREVFFVIRLQSSETANKMVQINDPDPLVPCELMDGRDTFLTSARENHYEFSSLRRAIYSTMCLTYDLHVQSQDFMYTCNNCKANVETRLHCSECEDFDLCKSCFRQVGHEHPMVEIGLGIDMGSPKNSSNPRNESVQRVIASLKHASQCKNANCNSVQCRQMKKVLHHAKSCRRQSQNTNCTVCRRLIVLCIYHAKHCQERNCVVPFCNNFRMKFRIQEKENRRRQSQLLARRVAYMNTERPTDRVNNDASMSGNVSTGDIANKAPRTPQQDQPLTPGQGNLNEPNTPGSQQGPGTPNSAQAMMKPGGINSPHNRRLSQQSGPQTSNVNMGGMSSPMHQLHPQILSPTGKPIGKQNYQPPFSKPPDKARMAANQAQAIADFQANSRTGPTHGVHQSNYLPMLSGNNVSNQWSQRVTDPNFMNKEVVGNNNNSPGVIRTVGPRALVHQNIPGMRSQKPGGYYNVVRGRRPAIMRPADDGSQQGTVIGNSQGNLSNMNQQISVNQPGNMSLPPSHMGPWPKRMRPMNPGDYYSQQPMRNPRMMSTGPVNSGQKMLPQQYPVQQQHRIHNQQNTLSQMMQPHPGQGMQGNNQQTMMSSQQPVQINQPQQSMLTSPVMNTGAPQGVGGIMPQQQNSGNMTPSQNRLPQMSPGNMVHNSNLTGPSNQMDQHFNPVGQPQQQQAQSQQGGMMPINSFNRNIQMTNRQVHTNITYGGTPQVNNQQSDMLNSTDSIDKFMGSTE